MVSDMRLFASMVFLLLTFSGSAFAAPSGHPAPKVSGAQKPADDASDESAIALQYEDHQAWVQKNHVREHELDRIGKHWGRALRAAYARLRKAAAEFADASSSNETDQSGTGRGEFADEMYTDEMDDFLHTLQAGERGDFPRYSESEFIRQDKKLNEAYRRVMHPENGESAQSDIFTGIATDGVREAQRAWLRYRDAWVAFARLRYPSVPAFAWKAMLTEKRIAQLNDLEGVE